MAGMIIKHQSGASATTPASGKTNVFVDTTGNPSIKDSSGNVRSLMRKYFSYADEVNADSTEVIIWESSIDFDPVSASGASIAVFLAGIARTQSTNTGTVRVYVGATAPGNTSGGTVRSTISIASNTSDSQVESAAGTPFTNPGGRKLVQVTLQSSTGGQLVYLRGFEGGIG